MSSSILLQGQLHDFLRLLQTPDSTPSDKEEIDRLRCTIASTTHANVASAAPLSYQILAYLLENLDSFTDALTWMPTSRSPSSLLSISQTSSAPKYIMTPDRIREVFEEVYGESIWSIVGTEMKTRQILQSSSLRSTGANTVPEYKIVLLGPGGVGKTQIIEQLISGNFNPEYLPTVETQTTVPLIVDGQECILQILDTAGQDEYSAIRKFWMEEGHGFMLVYSISSQSSLDEVVPLRDELVKLKGFSPTSIVEQNPPATSSRKSSKSSSVNAEANSYYSPVPMMLVGAKADLSSVRRVKTDQGKLMAGRLGCYFAEVSAKTRWNIPKCFYDLVRAMRRVEGPPKSQGEADWRRKEVERREKELRLRERRMKETEKQLVKWRKKYEKKFRKSTRSPASGSQLFQNANTVWSHTSRKDDAEATLEQLMEEGANIRRYVSSESVAKHIASSIQLPELSDESFRSIQVRLQAFEFKVEEPTELYIQLYDNTKKLFVSEEFQILLNPRASVLSIPLSTRTAIFSDLSPQEMKNDLLLVCRLLRRSPYNRFSDNAVGARFPAGYAVCSLERQLSALDSATSSNASTSRSMSAGLECYNIDVLKTFRGYYKRFWGDSENETASTTADQVLYPSGLVLEVSFDPKPYSQLTELQLANSPTDFALIRRQGLVFHAATPETLRDEMRSDIYITLVSGHFASRAPGARPGCPIDVEVSMSIRLNSGWAVTDSISVGRGFTSPTTEYNSPIMLRSQDPAWWETVRLGNLPSGALHVYFQIRLIHPTEARFSLLHAYLRLVKESTALQDGTYVLRVFSNTSNSKDPAFYLKEQGTVDDPSQDSLIVRLQMASLVHTQSEILTQLSQFRLYPAHRLQPVLQTALQTKSLVFRIETIKLYSRLLPMLLALTHSSKHVSLKNLSVQVLCAFTKNFAKLPHYRIILQHVLRSIRLSHSEDITNVVNTLQVFALAQTRPDGSAESSEDKFISFVVQMFEMDQMSPLLSQTLKKLFVSYELLQRSAVLPKFPKSLETKLLPAVYRQLDFFLQGLAYRNSDPNDLTLTIDIIEWLLYHILFQIAAAPSTDLNLTLSRL